MLPNSSFAAHAALAKASPDWLHYEIKTGHDAMVTEPAETARLFLDAVAVWKSRRA